MCWVTESEFKVEQAGAIGWRRKWQPTPVFLPGESQGRGSLVGCRLWGRTESDMTEATQQHRLSPLFGTSTNVCTQDIYARILLKNQSWLTPYALDLFISAVNPCLVSIYASHCKRGPKLRCCLLKLHSIRNQLSYILAFFTECSCYFFTRIKYSFLMSVSFLGHLLKCRELQS